MANSRRERIVQEFIRRVRVGMVDVPIERGFIGGEVSTFPIVYVFEGPEEVEQNPKRLDWYVKEFHVVFDYLLKTEERALYETANEQLYKFIGYIETDKRITDATGNELVLDYGLAGVDMALYRDGIINIEAMYRVRYAEVHRGY